MKNPIAEPTNTSDGECLRPPQRETLTVDANPYAKIGIHFCSEYSRLITRASDHAIMECPDGKESPPLKKPTLWPWTSGRGLCVASFKMLTVMSASINASIPI